MTSFDSDYTDNTVIFETEIDTRADLEVNKTGPATATAGEQVTYTIVLTNNGPSYAATVDVKDLLPPGVTFDSGTSSQGLCVNAICQLNEVAPGTPITMVITGTVGSDVTGLITNTAQAFSATTDDNKANNSDTAPTTVNARTALQIAKRDLTDPVYAGGSYFYEIVITNTGPSDAANTVVTDTLPTALTVLGVSPECTFSNTGSPSTVSCAVGSFPAGTSRDFLVNVQVASGVVSGTVGVNTAGITTTTPIDTANSTLLTTQNTTYLQTSGLPTDLQLTKSASPASVIAGGGQVTFTLRVTNAGPSPASAVQVVDAFPAAFTLVSATTSKDTSISLCSTGGTCDLGDMAVNASAIITLVYTVPAGVSAGTYTNTAHVSSPSADSNSANNTATAPVIVTERSDLSIRKVANPNPAIPGQDLTYTIIVTNAGPSDADSVTVADSLPAGFTLALVTASQGGCAALPCNLGTIPAGGNATLTIVGAVNASATAAQLANTATVSSAQTDPVPGNNSGTVSPAIATGADLELVKTGTPTANPGDTVVYTVTVRNLGPSDAAGVRVTDTLPAGLTLTGVVGCTNIGSGNQVVCNLGTRSANTSLQFQVSATVNASVAPGTSLENTASVSSTTADSNPLNNSATADTSILGAADLTISKTQLTAGPIHAGDLVTYTITVTNSWPGSGPQRGCEGSTPRRHDLGRDQRLQRRRLWRRGLPIWHLGQWRVPHGHGHGPGGQ